MVSLYLVTRLLTNLRLLNQHTSSLSTRRGERYLCEDIAFIRKRFAGQQNACVSTRGVATLVGFLARSKLNLYKSPTRSGLWRRIVIQALKLVRGWIYMYICIPIYVFKTWKRTYQMSFTWIDKMTFLGFICPSREPTWALTLARD